MNREVQRIIPADHPSLAGHFPGRPIVPGVVILDEVIQALLEWLGDCRPRNLPMVKFLAPLKPEQAFIIRLSRIGECQVKFECVSQGRTLVQGRIEWCAKMRGN